MVAAALSKRSGVDELPTSNIVKTRETEGDPGLPTFRPALSPERKGIRRVVMSQRHEQLARPRKEPDVVK